MTLFKLQIVPVDAPIGADPIQLPGGSPLEVDLIAEAAEGALQHQLQHLDRPEFAQRLEDAIAAKGVGVFRTEAQVRRAIQAGLAEVMTQQRADLRSALLVGLSGAVATLKEKTRLIVRRRK